MGTALAPTYANLFMDRFETRALKGWDKQPLLWLRFIDDIFMIWNHGQEELNGLLNTLTTSMIRSSLHMKLVLKA